VKLKAAIPTGLLGKRVVRVNEKGEKGAFTGASQSGKTGRFEFAIRARVPSDELGDIPWCKRSLLRVFVAKSKNFERWAAPKKSALMCVSAANIGDLLNGLRESFRRKL